MFTKKDWTIIIAALTMWHHDKAEEGKTDEANYVRILIGKVGKILKEE